MEDKREVEMYIENINQWIPCNFTVIRKGYKFRLYDKNGYLVKDDGRSEFVAKSDPYLNEDNIWTVDVEG